MLGWTEPPDSSRIDRMADTPSLMTIEEFCKLPEDDGPVYHELRHGEVVPVTRPKLKHQMIQSRLRRLLEPLAPPGALVEAEVAFRALPAMRCGLWPRFRAGRCAPASAPSPAAGPTGWPGSSRRGAGPTRGWPRTWRNSRRCWPTRPSPRSLRSAPPRRSEYRRTGWASR